MEYWFKIVTIATHVLVFAVGVAALLGLAPLARGRRSGVGLILMAASMGVVIMEPTWRLGFVGAIAYSAGFLTGLWLLIGPELGGKAVVRGKPESHRALARGDERS